MAQRALRLLLALLLLVAGVAGAAEYRSTADVAVLYDAPSLKSRPLFALGRDYPLEVIVNVEGWLKVRDVGGTIAWIEKKSVADKRVLIVRGTVADILAGPEAGAPVVFRAEPNVLLELVDPEAMASTPGWVKVRHRDGQVGFVRIQQVWGL
jgi:SH3-like domain-containing protein